MAEIDDLLDQALAGQTPTVELPGPPEPKLAPALGLKPDEEAKKQKLSVSSGLPREAVEADPAAVERELLDRAIMERLNTAPSTKQFMTDPDNAKIAHDSVDDMAETESYFGAITNAFDRAGSLVSQIGAEYAAEVFSEMAANTKRSALLPAETKQELLGVTESSAANARLRLGDLRAESAAIPRSEQATRSLEALYAGYETGGMAGVATALREDPLGALALAAEMTVESSPALVAPVAGALVGGPAGMLAGTAASSFIFERYSSPAAFLEARGYDLTDPAQALAIVRDQQLMKDAEQYGFRRGAVIAAVDTASLGALSKIGGRLVTRALAGAAVESAGGAIGEVGAQVATEGSVTDPVAAVLESLAGFVTGPAELAGIAVAKGHAEARVFLADRQAAKKAEEDLKNMDAAKKHLDASPLTQRYGDKAAEHLSQVLEGTGVTEVGIPVEKLDEVLGENAPAFYAAAGITTEDIAAARLLGGDVRLTGEQFAKHVMMSPDYEKLKVHVRFGEDGVTAAEAEEFQAGGFEDALDRVEEAPETAAPVAEQDEFAPAREAVALAEAEMGTQAMFKTAEEAGMTELEFKNQSILRAKAADAARKQQELKILKEKNRALSKEWQEEAAKLEPSVAESVNQQPVYNAINYVQQLRLDRNEIVSLMGDEKFLENLPKQGKRRIYTAKGEEGMSVAALAELFEFRNPEEMLWAMATAKPVKEAIAGEVTHQMEATHGTLKNDIQALESAIETLHSSEREDALMAELDAVRTATGQKRISAALLRTAAHAELQRTPLRDLVGKTNKFLSAQTRHAKAAGKQWRAKKYPEAARTKFQQVLNFQMARQVIKVRDHVAAQKKYLDRFTNPQKKWDTVQLEYVEQIRGLLDEFYLGNPASPTQKQSLLNFIAAKAQQGIQIDIPARFLALNTQPDYKNQSLAEWTEMHDTVKALHQAGQRENRFINADRNFTVSQAVAPIAAAVMNMKVDKDPQSAWGKFMKTSRAGRKLLVHVRTLLRQIDGWKDFGPAYKAIRQVIVDAKTKGYLPGSVGYIARWKETQAKLNEIYGVYSAKEMRAMQDPITVLGVREDRNMTHERVLSVLFHSGNQGNINALLASGQYTMSEVMAIRDFASKRDLDFAQALWDLNESFWAEREAAEIRRNNVRPVKVQPLPFSTRHGDYAGGYMPIMYEYESVQAHATASFESASQVAGFYSNAAAPVDHTLTARTNSGGREVALNLLTPARHLRNVVYGLEMGDATIDAWKVIHHPDLKKAFQESGNWPMWEAINGWMRDMVTGEIVSGADFEVRMRRWRSRFVFAKMALNVSVAAFQLLGLTQSAQVLGGGGPLGSVKGLRRLARGVSLYAAAPQIGEDSIYNVVANLDPRMAHRMETWNTDMLEIQHRMYESSLRKGLSAKGIEYYENLAFVLPKYMQRATDTITWLAAKRHGMEIFQGDEAKSTEYAYDTVIASQGSGLWMDRSLIERGQLDPGRQPSEMVRLFSPLISFFATRTSLAYETVARAGFQKGAANIVPNMGAAVGLALSLVLLYVVDGMVVGLARGEWPDGLDEDEEPAPLEMPVYVAQLMAGGIAAGIPGAREIASSVRGFEGSAGVIGSVLESIQKMTEQVSQIEWDEAFEEGAAGFDVPLAKSITNVAATLARIPATAINRYTELAKRATDDIEENDPTLREWVIGPDYPEKK